MKSTSRTATASRDDRRPAKANIDGEDVEIRDGAVLIAAITSCTNTSNPAVMVGCRAAGPQRPARGLKTKPWVKTSLAPGSKVVTDYLEKSRPPIDDLESLGFNVVGYGCTTCIGNSGPLKPEIEKAVKDNELIGTSVLSGNRNFEGRIHPLVKHEFPGVAAAGRRLRAGRQRCDVDLFNDPLGTTRTATRCS